MKGMILAAGYGKRMLPLTRVLPKPLIPVAGIPGIDYSINLLKEFGIKEIIINTHHKKEELVSGLTKRWHDEVDIQFSHEETLLGTAGGIKKAEDFLKNGSFIVINSDILIDIDLKEAVGLHKSKKALITMVLRKDENADRYGIIGIDKDKRVERFLKAGSDRTGLTETMFTGIQIFEPEIFDKIPAGRPCHISDEVYPLLIKEGAPVFGFVTENYWIDIGNHKRYLKANDDMLHGRLSLFEQLAGKKGMALNNYTKGEGITIIPPVLIDESVNIKAGSSIGPSAVIGKNSVLGKGVIVKESVLWENTRISDHAEIDRSIIGLNATIEKGAKIKEQIAIIHDETTRFSPLKN